MKDNNIIEMEHKRDFAKTKIMKVRGKTDQRQREKEVGEGARAGEGINNLRHCGSRFRASQSVHVLIPRTRDSVTSHSSRDSADVIKARTLR